MILGLGGKPHSGKTVAAECLKRVHGAVIYSISDLICMELGVKREEVREPRLLQNHGKLRRHEDPDYWTKRIGWAIDADQADIAIIPNIRMLDEVEMVRARFGHLIRFTRFNPDGSHHISSDRDMNHPLETSLDLFNWDFHITAKCGEKRLVELQTLALVTFLKECKSTAGRVHANAIAGS